MKWFDKLFGSSGSSHDYDGEGYYYGHPPPYNSGGWNGPDFFSDPRRRDEGTSYANDWPFYPNDRPYYSHERPPYPSDTQSNEELDRAIALSLAEDHRRERPAQDLEDEQLAKALQESLNVDSRPRFGNPFFPPHVPEVVPRQTSDFLFLTSVLYSAM